ncbi:MAG TPA: DNA mismatch repair endonuclease MutL [Thermodesulfobacteriota bacterium]|nr:DNA mismatch repair endonuclease MutL [Thermodesulfobacteriota bacterium]
MPGKVQVLPEALSRVIAAGEVIERPSSVVKELMENAIDAGASEVVVELKAGGFQLIRVQDNGEGMDREDVPIALQRHATSKIRRIEDLCAIQTLGFRGEALPSIASVSQMIIKTRARDSITGTRLACDGGEIKALSDAGCPAGTEVEVRNLFFNLPVKRKFLRSISLELRHASSHFLRLSLAHPSISFKFIHDGRLLHDHWRTDSLKVRMETILGREIYDQLQLFEHEEGEIHLSGLASLPTFSRGNAEGIYLYVNRRFVRDRAVYKAIQAAYRHVIPQGRFPVVVLFLDLPPSAVDANVHPAKTEVKFRESEKIFPAVLAALSSLHEPVSPSKDTQWAGHSKANPHPEAQALPLPFPRSRSYPQGGSLERETFDFKVCEGVPQEEREENGHPFRILGQILNTYILCENPESLIFIDQHAAHERILFERLKRAYEAKSLSVVRFLTPILMECSSEETLTLTSHLQDFHEMGFEVDRVGENVFAVRSVPSLIDQGNAREVIRRVLEELIFEQPFRKGRETLHPILVALSCHSAVRANFGLKSEEIEALVKNLQAFPLSTTCPHGRPVFFCFPLSDLERQFKRNPR